MRETVNRDSSSANDLRNDNRFVSELPKIEHKRVGRYDIIYPIAVGGMATVYVGRISGMAGFERLVAVKIIHPHLAQEQSFVEMFLDEARHAAGIHHQNVGEIYEVGEDSGLYYMVGELVLGQDLNRLLARASEREQIIDHTLCAYTISRVCRGLHEAHELTSPEGEPINLVHRDISPRNIVISYKGDVKVIDFGVAWAKGRLAHTEAGSVKGKVGFIPPEHIRGETLDRRSDIFALGVVLYLLTTRVHPFPGMSDAERLTKILTGRMILPRSIEPQIEPELEAVIVKAMAPKREERYQTAAAMGKELDVFVLGQGSKDYGELLAKMMVGFFKPEIKSHHEKIREYRKLHNEPTDSYTPTEDTSGVRTKESLNTNQAVPKKKRQIAYKSKARFVPSVFDRLGRWVKNHKSAVVKGAVVLGGLILASVVLVGVLAPDHTPNPAIDKGNEQVAFIILTLDISEADATITFDGRVQGGGLRELTIPADKKTHSLMVEKNGYFTHYDTITADKDKVVVIELKRLPHATDQASSTEDGLSTGKKSTRSEGRPRTKRNLQELNRTKDNKTKRQLKHKQRPKNDRKDSTRSPTLERSPYR